MGERCAQSIPNLASPAEVACARMVANHNADLMHIISSIDFNQEMQIQPLFSQFYANIKHQICFCVLAFFLHSSFYVLFKERLFSYFSKSWS